MAGFMRDLGAFCDYVPDQSRGLLLSWDKTSLALQPGPELTNRQPTSNTADCTWTGNHPGFLSSIWMSGYGVATDTSGNVYFTTGNSASGTYDGTDNIAEITVKMSRNLTTASVFTPSDVNTLDSHDTDYANYSGCTTMALSGATPVHPAAALPAQAGKCSTTIRKVQRSRHAVIRKGQGLGQPRVSCRCCDERISLRYFIQIRALVAKGHGIWVSLKQI